MASPPADLPTDARPLEGGARVDVDDAWVTELERRANEVRSGVATTEDWASVKIRLADGWRRR